MIIPYITADLTCNFCCLIKKMNVYLQRIPHCVSVLSDLLVDRGYPAHPQVGKSVKDLISLASQTAQSFGALLSCVLHNDNDRDSIYVAFLDPLFDVTKHREVMTSSYQMHGVLEKAKEGKANHILIISYSKLSPDASKAAAALIASEGKDKRDLQILTFAQLSVSLRNHTMIPAHTLLTEKEAKTLEKHLNISRSQLPILKWSDPMRTWHNWPKNGVVHILRPTGSMWRWIPNKKI